MHYDDYQTCTRSATAGPFCQVSRWSVAEDALVLAWTGVSWAWPGVALGHPSEIAIAGAAAHMTHQYSILLNLERQTPRILIVRHEDAGAQRAAVVVCGNRG